GPQDDAAVVRRTGFEGQAVLHHPPLLRTVDGDYRAVLAHPGPFGVQRDRGNRPDGHPLLHEAHRAAAVIRLAGTLGQDAVVELAVVERLAPQAVVDQVADVLDEAAVDHRRNRRTRYRGIDGGGDATGG